MGSMLVMLGLLLSLVGLVCFVIVLISAFQEEAVQGILCFCVPFYIFYYALVRYQSDNKPIIVGGLLIGFIGGILRAVGKAMLAG